MRLFLLNEYVMFVNILSIYKEKILEERKFVPIISVINPKGLCLAGS